MERPFPREMKELLKATAPRENPLSTAKNIPETRIKENNAAQKKGMCVKAQKLRNRALKSRYNLKAEESEHSK